MISDNKALLVIDVQNDFCPGGNLAVADGDQVVPVINRLMEAFDLVVLTQDWHPSNHKSLASNHVGVDPFSMIEMTYGPQVLWPDHCVQGSAGAEFHMDLNTDRADLIVRKGVNPEIDSYSAFYENDHTTSTGLSGYLRARGIDTLYLAGLATDFCVRYSAVDAVREGFAVTMVEDAVRGIDLDGSMTAAMAELKENNVMIMPSGNLN